MHISTIVFTLRYVNDHTTKQMLVSKARAMNRLLIIYKLSIQLCSKFRGKRLHASRHIDSSNPFIFAIGGQVSTFTSFICPIFYLCFNRVPVFLLPYHVCISLYKIHKYFFSLIRSHCRHQNCFNKINTCYVNIDVGRMFCIRIGSFNFLRHLNATKRLSNVFFK